VTALANACDLSYFFVKSSIISHTVNADGVNTLNFDMMTLIIESIQGLALTICGEIPTVTLTAVNFVSNNRALYFFVNGDKIYWAN